MCLVSNYWGSWWAIHEFEVFWVFQFWKADIHFLKIDAEGKDFTILESLSDDTLSRIVFVATECVSETPRFEEEKLKEEVIEYMNSKKFDVFHDHVTDNGSRISDVIFKNREKSLKRLSFLGLVNSVTVIVYIAFYYLPNVLASLDQPLPWRTNSATLLPFLAKFSQKMNTIAWCNIFNNISLLPSKFKDINL